MEVSHVPKNLPQPQKNALPSVKPLDLVSVEWKVLVINGIPYFALTSKQYENISKNQAEIERWVRDAAHRLEYYEEQTDVQ